MTPPDWAQPNPSDLTDPAGPPYPETEPFVSREALPATEVVLSELGAFYPIVAYPEHQASDDGEDRLDRTIYSGLVNG